MVIGSPVDDQQLSIRLVDELRCVIVSVDYRLAPEHPYPAPVEDGYAGLIWTAASAAALGIDPGRLAIGGKSAGAGLAAAAALMVRDRGGPAIALQMLLAPMLDDRNSTASSRQVTAITVWDRHMNLRGWQAFLGSLFGAEDLPPYASPGRVDDLGELPPTFIDVGTADLFRDEALEYATRLGRGGVPTEFHLWPGAYHGWDTWTPGAAISQATWRLRIEALRRAFDSPKAGL
jgi:acetyl esterase/lipase